AELPHLPPFPTRRSSDLKSVTVQDIAPLVDEAVSKAVAAIPAPKDGAPGKLPIAKEWSDGVHYEGDVRTHKGALWQAVKDTGREIGRATSELQSRENLVC